MKISFFLFFLLCTPFFCASQKTEKLREIYYNLEYFRRILRDDRQVSFSVDYLQEQEQNLRIQFTDLRQKIMLELLAEFSEGRRRFFYEFCNEVEQLSFQDPARQVFVELLQDLADRVKSELIGAKFMPFDRQYARLTKDLQRVAVLASAGKAAQEKSFDLSGKDAAVQSGAGIPIYISFLWHMHQPIYWPYEDVVKTHERKAYSYNVLDIFSSREGAYTKWPLNALQQGLDLPHFGVQLSISGSLIENLNSIENAGKGFRAWAASFRKSRNLKTVLGNSRLDIVGSGFYHPVMPLLNYDNLRQQISRHREIVRNSFGEEMPDSKGIFPPENAFADWMIPALVDEGFSWVFVENIHFNRAVVNYPWDRSEKMFPPNRADQQNPPIGKWVQLGGLWAPSKVSAWSYRPHYVACRDPQTGELMRTVEGREAKMIAVPTARYMGNELGRAGFSGFDYERVFSQLEAVNNDPDHPILIVLHHDGDNHGGGSQEYYHEGIRGFIEWARKNRHRFVPTTVEDYLNRFPVEENDVVHVEPGSWLSADGGGPDFHKWLAPEDPETGYSPDMNTWGTLVAAANYVHTAHAVFPEDEKTRLAWDYLLVGETSCYTSWDGTEMWDSHATRAANKAVGLSRVVLSGHFEDKLPPTVFGPHRQPFNPGAFESRVDPEPNDVRFWAYVYDVSGLEKVLLHYRQKGVKEWQNQEMKARYVPSKTVPRPIVKAHEYSATLYGQEKVELEYFIEALDKAGNRVKTHVRKVYVDKATGWDSSPWEPEFPSAGEKIKIYASDAGFLHWGVNNWVAPVDAYWPDGSYLWSDGKAIHTRLQGPDEQGRYFAEIGPFESPEQPVKTINFVFRFHNNLWGSDRRIELKSKSGK
jgi:hypothetical protein